MPEGPETKTMADGISKALIGKEISSYKFLYKTLYPLRTLKSFNVTNVMSRGKAIIISLNNNFSIITHNQLYGKWTFHRPSTLMKTNRQLRIEFSTKTKVVRLWSATDILVYKSNDLINHPYLKKLGPDILDKDTTITTVLDQLKKKKFKNRSLSSILLDQSFIAGLGNYLRSEILFFSKIMFSLKPSELDTKGLEKLSREIKIVSLRAYYQKGKTIDFEYIEKTFGNIDNFKRLKHMVFGREGLPCFLCGNKILKYVIASRRIYVCENCQKKNKT